MKNKLMLVAVGVLLSGCAGMQVQKELQTIQAWMDPRVGTEAKEEILQTLGAPTSQMDAGNLEIWNYYMPMGTGGNVNNVGYTAGVFNNSVAYDNRHERYDKLTCAFDEDGKLVWWRSYVQR